MITPENVIPALDHPAGDELSTDDNSEPLPADAGEAQSVTGEQFPTSPDVGADRADTGYCVLTPTGYLEKTFRRRPPTDKMVAELEPPAVWVRV